MIRTTLTATIAALALAGCATAPDEIAPSYVAPSAYAGMSCARLADEHRAATFRLGAIEAQQAQQASNDATMTAVSLFLFWPAMFAVGNGPDHAGEIAQLRGQANAIGEAMRARGC